MVFYRQLAAALVIALLSTVDGWQLLTTKIVDVPSPKAVGLLDLVSKTSYFKYSDPHKKVTAIKDGKFKSCFLVDYDPYWTLEDEDKFLIISKTKAVNDSERLARKAGFVITHMCKKMKQFWMTSDDMPPPPMMMGNVGSPQGPPEVKEPPHVEQVQPPKVFSVKESGEPDQAVVPPFAGNSEVRPPIAVQNGHRYDDGSSLNAPPKMESSKAGASVLSSVLQGPPPMRVQGPIDGAPPMLPSGHQNEESTIKAPPPLQIWRQSHPESGPSPPKQEGGNDMLPPPLAVQSNERAPSFKSHEQGTNNLVAPPLKSDLPPPPRPQNGDVIGDVNGPPPPMRPNPDSNGDDSQSLLIEPKMFQAPPRRTDAGPEKDDAQQKYEIKYPPPLM